MRPLSSRNPRVIQLAKLARSRRERDDQRALLVEGPTLLAAALDAGAQVVDVFVDGDAGDRSSVTMLLDRLPADVGIWVVPAGTLDRVGDVATSQGVLGVVRREDPPWPTTAETDFVVVLADVADPGNAGTLLRAATAAGAGAVVLAGGVDHTNPKVVRSSAGAVFGIPVVVAPEPGAAIRRLRGDGYRVVGTVVRDGEAYDRADLRGPVAIVVGNEAHGLSEACLSELDLAVTIPMAGPTESLNVAMAATLVCFEVLRQRRQTS